MKKHGLWWWHKAKNIVCKRNGDLSNETARVALTRISVNPRPEGRGFTAWPGNKAERVGKGYIEVNRFFPSSKTCSCCGVIASKMPLNIRSWKCDNCSTVHDRDINASKNIALEAKRMIAAGIVGTASRGDVRRGRGRKSSVHATANEAGSPAL